MIFAQTTSPGPLDAALLLVVLLALFADAVILARWIQITQSRKRARLAGMAAEADVPTVPAYDVVAAPGYDVAPSAASAVPPTEAKGAFPAWSLIHPFVGFQIVLLAVGLIAGFIVGLVAGIAHPGVKPDAATTAHLTDDLQLLAVWLQNLLGIAGVAYLLKGYGTSLVGIGLRRPTLRQIALGIGLGIVLLLASNLLQRLLELGLTRFLSSNSLDDLKRAGEKFDAGCIFSRLQGFAPRLLFVLGGAILAPLGEEIFFRGLVYNALKRRMRIGAAIVVSGLLFALAHVSPLNLLLIFPMGMFMAYVYERTGSLWVTIIMHAFNNGAVFLALWLTASGRQ